MVLARHLAWVVAIACLAVGSSAQGQCLLTEEVRFAASDGVGDNRFGTSLDIDGDVAVFGAFLDSSRRENSGSAYVYRWDGQQWN